MANLRTGAADVKPDLPSHVPWINQGNAKGNYEKQRGHLSDGRRTARAATGVNPEAHDPIDPSMPNLPPA